jgi:hypothetical protein
LRVISLLAIIGGVFALFDGARIVMQAWTVRHWESVRCTVTKAVLDVPVDAQSSDDVRPLIEREFLWEGRKVVARNAGFYLSDLTVDRDNRVAAWEEILAHFRRYPLQQCQVNPEDPEATELGERSYRESLLMLIPGTLSLVAGILMMRHSFRKLRPLGKRMSAFRDLTLIAFFICAGVTVLLWPGEFYQGTAMEYRLVKVPCAMEVSTTRTRFAPDILFRYNMDDHVWHSSRLSFERNCTGWSAKDDVARYPAGSVQECWVDPERPWKAALEKTFEPRWRSWLLGMSSAGGGLAALIIWLRRRFRINRSG